MICQISSFNMGTTKHLVQTSCTELTLRRPGQRQQFLSQFFFISVQKHKIGYQKSCPWQKNDKNPKKSNFPIQLNFEPFCFVINCVLLRTEHNINKLRLPIFKRFCFQYPIINYLDILPENRREQLLFNQETLVQLQEVLLYQLWDHLMGFQIKQR